MKVLVYVGLFKGSGVGNVMRMVSLSKYISNELYGTEVFWTGRNVSAIKELTQNQFTYVAFTQKDLEYIEKVDVIFVDTTEPNSSKVIDQLNYLSGKIIAFDFFKYDENRIDVIINLHHHFRDKLTSFSGRAYEGLEYAIINEDFFRLSTSKTKSGAVLVAFGGEDPTDRTHRVLSKIDGDIEVTCVLGKLYRGLARHHSYDSNIRLLEFTNDFAELMYKHEIVVCSGGTTIVESLFLGKEIFAGSQNAFEERFVDSLICKGYIHPLANLNQWLRSSDREWKSSGRPLLDGEGKKRIFDIVKEITGHD